MVCNMHDMRQAIQKGLFVTQCESDMVCSQSFKASKYMILAVHMLISSIVDLYISYIQ